MDDHVPYYHLPLDGIADVSRQNTESLPSAPRAYTCPTYNSPHWLDQQQQQQQHQQEQQQQQQQQWRTDDAAAYLGYATFLNTNKSTRLRSNKEVGLLSVLWDDSASPSVESKKSEKDIRRENRKSKSDAKLCCGLLD